MIVDFPEAKKRLYKQLVSFAGAQVRAAFPLIDLVGVRRQYEGEILDYNTMDGACKEMEYLQHSFTASFDSRDFETLSIIDVRDKIAAGAIEMARGIAQSARDAITAATDEVGNVLRTTDMTDPENLLRMLEIVQVDFKGSRRRPDLPSLWGDANTIAEFNRRFGAMTDEQRHDHLRRREQILDRKYTEYVSRENDRKLVD